MYGLVTAFFPSLIYFLLGHSPILTVGPEATTSMMLGQAILALPEIKAAQVCARFTVPLHYSCMRTCTEASYLHYSDTCEVLMLPFSYFFKRKIELYIPHIFLFFSSSCFLSLLPAP